LENEFPKIAERITDGKLGMSAATVLLDLSADRRQALGQYIEMTPAQSITTGDVKRIAKLLKSFKFEMPLTFPNSTRRNVARGFMALWNRRYDENPVRAYLAACIALSSTSQYVPPWEDQAMAQEWLRALGEPVDRHWLAIIEEYVHEVSCELCPIMQLPARVLKVDLVSPSLPCRKGFKGQVGSCIHGLHPDDPFHMRVPMAWGEHPGVKREGNVYFVDTMADLRKAWEAQRDIEDKEAKKEERAQKRLKTAEAKSKKGGGASSATMAPVPAQSDLPSPVEKMRQQIAGFIQLHPKLNDEHFLAMTCDGCQHKLDGSPTSDPDVPPCAWASHNRTVRFEQLVPTQKGSQLQPIPICRQYAPERPWRELIPEYAAPSELPREWLLAQIRLLANDQRGNATYKPFQWLTGRPMTMSESYDGWFTDQLDANQGELSDGQVYALFVLAHTEWSRCKGMSSGPFLLPVNETLMQMEMVKVEIRSMAVNYE
jgi:hypothetical protein